MNKRILYIPEVDISKDDGPGINERNFIKQLLKKGINVLIPTPENEFDHEWINNSNLFKSAKLNRNNLFGYIKFLIMKIYMINYLLSKRKINTIVFRWGILPLDIVFVKMFYNKNIYLKHLAFLRTSQKEGYVHRIIGFIRKLLLKNSFIDACDTPSHVTKKIIVENYQLKDVEVSRNGTDYNTYLEVEREKEFIYIGRLSKKRNTDILLKTFKNTNRSIDIYGFGEMSDKVKKYDNQNENINFYGRVDYSYLKMIMPEYKFGIDLTYIDTEYGRASYSQKISLYLSYGLNVLAINSIDNDFIKENNAGILVEPTENDVKSGIASINFNPFNREDLGRYIFNKEIVDNLVCFWKEEREHFAK